MTQNCGNRAWLAGKQLLTFAGKPTENVTVKHLAKHMAYVFYKFHMCIFLYVLKTTKHTAHMKPLALWDFEALDLNQSGLLANPVDLLLIA